MVINNPYIEKVQQDSDILHIPEEIYTHKGLWGEYFGNNQDIVLEIGTGMGNFFAKQVGENPDKNYIGMEIRYKRLFQSAEKSRKAPHNSLTSESTSFSCKEKDGGGVMNNFVMLKDFAQNIDQIFIHEEISETYIFFPDPWPKDRHRKHRLLQEDFLAKLYSITKPGGKLFFKTDHREYFDTTKEILEQQGLWNIADWTHNYEESEIFDMQNITEFESMYRGEKTDINYIELVK